MTRAALRLAGAAAMSEPPSAQRGSAPAGYPLAAVMVALTTLTLWSLGQAIFVAPPAAAVVTTAAYLVA
ncbi:MAG: hypothetical protein M3R57_12110 [Chloroflexota bacterium]|nr:hypothetical protein [Chloroflexota bacterium]